MNRDNREYAHNMPRDEGAIRYLPPVVSDLPPKRLAVEGGTDDGREFVFYDRVEIGRLKGEEQIAGRLLVPDEAVSTRHCVITQQPDGRCFIRDLSLNGTRVDGRRLSPNLTTEIKVGQVIAIGRGERFRLEGKMDPQVGSAPEAEGATQAISDVETVTVLVGDIRNYTSMVQDASAVDLEGSVSRVFRRMEEAVLDLGGTIKEFQGDAIFAFWEESASSNHAAEACLAALRLQELAATLGSDRSVWTVGDFPLEVDFALATGPVAMRGHGGDHAVGLAMVGEPVVLAFRIEKLATEGTGQIVASASTREMASAVLSFESLGRHAIKGFEQDVELFALIGD